MIITSKNMRAGIVAILLMASVNTAKPDSEGNAWWLAHLGGFLSGTLAHTLVTKIVGEPELTTRAEFEAAINDPEKMQAIDKKRTDYISKSTPALIAFFGTWYIAFKVIYNHLYSETPTAIFAAAEKAVSQVDQAMACYHGVDVALIPEQQRAEVRNALQVQLAALEIAQEATNQARSAVLAETSNANYVAIRSESAALLEKIKTLRAAIIEMAKKL